MKLSSPQRLAWCLTEKQLFLCGIVNFAEAADEAACTRHVCHMLPGRKQKVRGILLHHATQGKGFLRKREHTNKNCFLPPLLFSLIYKWLLFLYLQCPDMALSLPT